MPGILGAVPLAPDALAPATGARMLALLSHLPWYGTGLAEADGVVLGAVSTSPHFTGARHVAEADGCLVALEGSCLEDDGRDLLCDPAPADRLVALYRAEGDGFVRRLRGSFNIGILERDRRRLLLCNDRFGFAHLYCYRDDRVLLFAPEIKAFLAHAPLDTRLDDEAVGYFLSADSVIGERTLLARVQLLPPGGRLICEDGRIRIERWWRPEFRPETGRAPEEFMDRGLELYRRALDRRLPAADYERIVFPLSGGLDSRLLLQILPPRTRDLRIFTHGQPDCLDHRLARRVTSALQLSDRHRLVRIRPDWMGTHAWKAVWLNDGQLPFRNANLCGVAESLEPGPVPFINGILGAFLSLGAGHFFGRRDIVPIASADELERKVKGRVPFREPAGIMEEVFGPAVARRLAAGCEAVAWEAFQPHRHHRLWCDQFSAHCHLGLARRVQGGIDVNRFYFHDVLPFVDEDLCDLYLAVPAELKLESRLYHDLHLRHFPALARIPWSNTGLPIDAAPQRVARALARRYAAQRWRARLSRATRGLLNLRDRNEYVHREIWLRRNHTFRAAVLPALRSAGELGLDVLDQRRIDRLLERFDSGRFYYWRIIAKLFTLVAWHRLFVGGEHAEHAFFEPAD
jgi:hypothetical protein